MSESHDQPCDEKVNDASCFVEDLEAGMDSTSKRTSGSAVSSPAMPSQHHLHHGVFDVSGGLDRAPHYDAHSATATHKEDWSRGSSLKRSSSCLLLTDEPASVVAPNVPFGAAEAMRQTVTVAAPTTTDDQRSDSFTTVASVLSVGEFCKICHCGAEINQPLIAPCFCSGSLKYVHQDCLQRWIKSSDIKRCELCKYPFDMQAKVKPFCSWELLDLSTTERRKLFCSVTFHFLAIVCVVWSLYILIDRTAEEIRTGVLAWPFWAKLVVVGIGFTGGLVFMYVQCKVYVHLFRKWKAYNRIIVVQDAPEGMTKTPAVVAVAGHQTTSENENVGGDFLRTSRSRSLELDTGRNVNVGTTAEPSGSESGGGQGNRGPEMNTQKSNAETQTALRGVSLVEVIHGSGGESCAEGGANSKSVKVVTLDGTEDSSTFFLSECECVDGDKRDGDAAGRRLGEKK